MLNNQIHIPVLLSFVIACFSSFYNGRFLDATVGLGGHSYYLLRSLSPSYLLGVDRDLDALKISKKRLSKYGSKVHLHHDKFSKINEYIVSEELKPFDCVLIDLGLSSLQLSLERGFSYRQNTVLDMRMNKTDKMMAADLINNSELEDIINILKRGGVRKNIYKLAKVIYENKYKISTTEDLAFYIRKTGYRKDAVKRLSQVFQSLRISVNDEYNELIKFLENITDILSKKSGFVSIAYHSGEDRIIKEYVKNWKKSGVCDVVFSHVIKPSKSEIKSNLRSRSAKLRYVRFTL